ncbi:unnamed protein product [Heligmosomoides polygyrus]|uniref:Uncharacterized protein n=1 Tax=Heligmosomoides polygyrus TaxID=6339 RepID=A0A183GJL8_HELPZ|nr:unnamed protein product [Heligmosomoides polygyrus]
MVEWITERRDEESVVLPPESSFSSLSMPPAAVVASSSLPDRSPPRLAGINRIRGGVTVTERSASLAYNTIKYKKSGKCEEMGQSLENRRNKLFKP